MYGIVSLSCIAEENKTNVIKDLWQVTGKSVFFLECFQWNNLHQLLVLLSAHKHVSSEVIGVNGNESCVGQYFL